MSPETNQDPLCCPQFDPAPWDDKIIEWENKRFVKDSVFTLFYMPLNFGSVIQRMNKQVEAAGATMPDYLSLSDHTSMWNMDLYLAVDKEVQGAENVTLSGKFFCKVYEGQYRDSGKWCKEYDNLAKSKNLKIKKLYLWYTTCPKCARKFGKNFVVIIGKCE